MDNGLLDIGILSFVFAPLAITIALILALWRIQIRNILVTLPANDLPGLSLNAFVRLMPEEMREWSAAMIAEIGMVRGWFQRWRFALGCIRVAIFPPGRDGAHGGLTGQSPVCGLLAVVAPPLGLPFIYFTALIMEAVGGSPLTHTFNWSNPETVIALVKGAVLLTIIILLAGLPLGLAGILRRERLRWLSFLGMFSSLWIIVYFLVVMNFVSGGPKGD